MAGSGRGRRVVCLGIFGVWCSQEGGLSYLGFLVWGTTRLRFNSRLWLHIDWLITVVGEKEG